MQVFSSFEIGGKSLPFQAQFHHLLVGPDGSLQVLVGSAFVGQPKK